MKILVYSQVYFPVLGGLQRNTFTLASILCQQGHRVTIITETPSAEVDADKFSIIRTQSLLVLAKEIKNCDLLIVNGGLSLKACLLAQVSGKKYLIIYQTAEGFQVNEGLKKFILSPLRKRLAKSAVKNVVQTEYASSVFRQYQLPVEVLQNPVDPMLLAYKMEKQELRYHFLFAGRVIEAKGIFLFIAAIKNLYDAGLNPSIAVAGTGAAMETAKAETRPFNIKFLGNIDKEELANAYQHSRILVVPTTGHMEGSPLVISEAISFGVPVICSDQPAMIEAVGSAGISFKSGDLAELTSLMSEVLTNDTYHSSLVSSTVNEARKFSPEHYANRIAYMLKTAIS